MVKEWDIFKKSVLSPCVLSENTSSMVSMKNEERSDEWILYMKEL